MTRQWAFKPSTRCSWWLWGCLESETRLRLTIFWRFAPQKLSVPNLKKTIAIFRSYSVYNKVLVKTFVNAMQLYRKWRTRFYLDFSRFCDGNCAKDDSVHRYFKNHYTYLLKGSTELLILYFWSNCSAKNSNLNLFVGF